MFELPVGYWDFVSSVLFVFFWFGVYFFANESKKEK